MEKEATKGIRHQSKTGKVMEDENLTSDAEFSISTSNLILVKKKSRVASNGFATLTMIDGTHIDMKLLTCSILSSRHHQMSPTKHFCHE